MNNAQKEAMKRFKKKNPGYFAQKNRELRQKKKLEFEQMKAKLEQYEKEILKK